MSRPATRQLTSHFVLRTLARVQMLTRFSDEVLAEHLLEHLPRREAGGHVQSLGEFLESVGYRMRELAPERCGHPHPACDECGQEVSCDHNGARFCSAKCRQRAYRKRLNGGQRRNKRHEPPVGDASFSTGDKTNVTAGGKP